MRNFSTNTANPFQFRFYLIGEIGLLFLAFIFRPFTIVNAGERGVVMHLGKVQDQVLDEGIHAITPIFTSIKKFSVRVQKNSFEGWE